MAIDYVPQRLPSVQKIPFSVNAWQGLNRVAGAEGAGEMVHMRNMSSDNIPFSSPRKPRKVIESGIENPQNLFAAGDKLGYIAGGKLYYDGNIVKDGNGNDVAVGETSAIVDFNGNVVMYPSNVFYDYVNGKTTTVLDTTDLTQTQGFYNTDGTEGTDAYNIITYSFSNGKSYRAAVFKLGVIDGLKDGDTVVINGSNITVWDNIVANLFILPFDGDGKKLTKDWYYELNFGVPIKIKNLETLKIMVGFYISGENTISRMEETCRDENFTSAAFWYSITGNYVVSDGIPLVQYATVDNNRVFAAQGNSIYASSQGNYAKWNEFADEDGNPNPLGSYAETLDTPQDITGIIKYRGNVVIVKPDLVYESFGNKPPYRIVEVAKTGCIDGRSVVEVNSVLYWLGHKGIYAYTGGQPRNISEKLNKTFENGIAGTDGRKYYISAYDGDKWELYVYDTYSGLWHIEDNKQFVGLAYADGHMHGLAKDGNVYKFGGGDERVEWEFETQDFTFGMPNKKTLSKIYIRVQMARYSDLDIYIKKDNGEFERKATYHANEFTTFDFKAKIKKFDSFALMFKGMGDVRVLDIHGDVTVGTAKHKHGDLSVFRG